MKYLGYLIAALMCFAAHTANAGDRTLVLKYADFGPPSMAWQTIGMDWWQWDNHGDSDPKTKYDIKVVVYKGIPLAQVKQIYPVVKSKEQDYRYLSYDTAIKYLERNIDANVKDNFLPKLTERLQGRRQRLSRTWETRPTSSGDRSPMQHRPVRTRDLIRIWISQVSVQGRPMAYDRIDWHYGGEDYPEDLAYDNGGTHIGLFLAWAINRGLEGELHQVESQEALKAVRNRTMTGRQVSRGTLRREILGR